MNEFFQQIEYFSEELEKCNNIFSIPKYWVADISCDNENKYLVRWTPIEKSPLSENTLFCMKHPTQGDINNKVKFIKENVLRYIVRYIKKQKLSFVPKMDKSQIYFDIEINHNPLVAYVLYSLENITNKKIEYCECGCGQMLSRGKKYHSPKCQNRVKNNTDRAKLKAIVRNWNNRDKITCIQKEELYSIIDDKINSDKPYEEMKNILNEKLQQNLNL